MASLTSQSTPLERPPIESDSNLRSHDAQPALVQPEGAFDTLENATASNRSTIAASARVPVPAPATTTGESSSVFLRFKRPNAGKRHSHEVSTKKESAGGYVASSRSALPTRSILRVPQQIPSPGGLLQLREREGKSSRPSTAPLSEAGAVAQEAASHPGGGSSALQRSSSVSSATGAAQSHMLNMPSWISRLPSSAQSLIASAVDHMSSMRIATATNTPNIDEEEMQLSDEESSYAAPIAALLPTLVSNARESSTTASSNGYSMASTVSASGNFTHVLVGGWRAAASAAAPPAMVLRVPKRVRFSFHDSVHVVLDPDVSDQGPTATADAPAQESDAVSAVQPLEESTLSDISSSLSTTDASEAPNQPAEETVTKAVADHTDPGDAVRDDAELVIDGVPVRFSRENLHWTHDGKDKHPRAMYPPRSDSGDANEVSAQRDLPDNDPDGILDERADGVDDDDAGPVRLDQDRYGSESDLLFDPSDLPDAWDQLTSMGSLALAKFSRHHHSSGDSKSAAAELAKETALSEDAELAKSDEDTQTQRDAEKIPSEAPQELNEPEPPSVQHAEDYTIGDVYQVYIRDLEKRRDRGLQSVIDSMNQAFRQGTHLRRLDLKGDPINRRCVGSICQLLQLRSGLGTLILDNCNIEDSFLKLLLDSLLVSDTVHTLSLARSTRIRIAGAKFLAIYLRKSRAIRVLDLSYVPFDGRGLAYIGHGLYEEIVRNESALTLGSDTLGAAKTPGKSAGGAGNVQHTICLVSQLRVLRMDGIVLRRNTSTTLGVGAGGSGGLHSRAAAGAARLGWDTLFRRVQKSRVEYFSVAACRLREVVRNWGPELLRDDRGAPANAPPKLPSITDLNSPTNQATNQQVDEDGTERVCTGEQPVDPTEATKATTTDTVEELPVEPLHAQGLLGVNLSWNPMGTLDMCLLGLGQALAVNHRLRYLILSGCNLGEAVGEPNQTPSNAAGSSGGASAALSKEARSLEALLAGCKSNYSVRYLDLSHNPIARHLSLVTDLIGHCRALRILVLRHIGLSSASVIAMAECLPLSESLIRLDLSENPGSIDIASLMALNASIKLNNSLLQVDLTLPADARSDGDGANGANDHEVVQLFVAEVQALCDRNLNALSPNQRAEAASELDEFSRLVQRDAGWLATMSITALTGTNVTGAAPATPGTVPATPINALGPSIGSSSTAGRASGMVGLGGDPANDQLAQQAGVAGGEGLSVTALPPAVLSSSEQLTGLGGDLAASSASQSNAAIVSLATTAAASTANSNGNLAAATVATAGPGSRPATAASVAGSALETRLRQIFQVEAPLVDDDGALRNSSLAAGSGQPESLVDGGLPSDAVALGGALSDQNATDEQNNRTSVLSTRGSAARSSVALSTAPSAASGLGSTSSSNLSSPVSFSDSASNASLGISPRTPAAEPQRLEHILEISARSQELVRESQERLCLDASIRSAASAPKSPLLLPSLAGLANPALSQSLGASSIMLGSSVASAVAALGPNAVLDPLLEHFTVDDA